VEAVCGRLFFFSSRRRHTRSTRDWSSDVCSSDLAFGPDGRLWQFARDSEGSLGLWDLADGRRVRRFAFSDNAPLAVTSSASLPRSEERRVGKEGEAGGGTGNCGKN